MLPESYQWARQALREAQEIGRQAFVGMAYRVLGQIAVAAQRMPEVNLPGMQNPEIYFERSVQIARETDNPAEEAQSLRAWRIPDTSTRCQ